MICPRCGYEYSEQLEHCPICRNETPKQPPMSDSGTTRFCPHCGAPVTGLFCQNCGARVAPQGPAGFQQNPNTNPYQPPYQNRPPFTPPSGAPFGPSSWMHPMTAAYQRSLREHPETPKLSKWMKALIVFCIIFYIFSIIGSAFNSISIQYDQYEINQEVANDPYWQDPFTDPYYNDGSDFYGTTSLNPAGCSSEELRKLKTGMTYAQISAIIGGDAQREDTSLETDENSFAAVWMGEENPYMTVTVVFEDGEAVSISSSDYLF